jgi:hypothetical protein
MIGFVLAVGFLAFVAGFAVLFTGSKSKGSMNISLGEFKGPAWFLLIVIGILLMAFGFL